MPNSEIVIPELKNSPALEKQIKQLVELQNSWKGYVKTVSTSLASLSELEKHHARINSQLRQNVGLLRQQTQEATKAEKAINGLGSGLKKVAGLLGVASLGYFLTAKIKSVVSSRIDLGVLGGAQQLRQIENLIRGTGIPSTSAFSLVSGFQRQSPLARFDLSRQPSLLRGLLNAQKQLAPVGLDKAQELLLGVTGSLDKGNLTRFLRGAGKDPELALLRAASGGNVGDVTSALNALSIAKVGSGDPALEASVKMQQSLDRLNASVEDLLEKGISKLLPAIDFLSASITKIANNLGLTIGVGAGLYAGSKILPRMFGGGLGGGIPGRVVAPDGAWTPTVIRQIFPPKGLLPGPGGAPALPWTSTLGPYIGPSGGSKIGAGAFAAYGVGSLADSIYSTVENKRAAKWNLAGRLGQKVSGMSEVYDYQDMLDRQKAFVANKIAQLSPADKKTFDNLQADKGTSPFKVIGDVLSNGGEKIKNAFTAVEKTLLRFRLQGLQKQAARQQDLLLRAEKESSITTLKRQAFELARISPFGDLAAMPQLADLLTQLNKEITSQTKILGNIDTSTEAGKIAANKQISEINDLKIQEKSLRINQQKAYLDAAISDIFHSGIGPFEKILVDANRNQRQGLEKGILNKNLDFVTGGLGGSTRHGIDPREFFGGVNPYAGVAAKIRSSTVNKSTVSDPSIDMKKAGELLVAASEKMSQSIEDSNSRTPQITRPTTFIRTC